MNEILLLCHNNDPFIKEVNNFCENKNLTLHVLHPENITRTLFTYFSNNSHKINSYKIKDFSLPDPSMYIINRINSILPDNIHLNKIDYDYIVEEWNSMFYCFSIEVTNNRINLKNFGYWGNSIINFYDIIFHIDKFTHLKAPSFITSNNKDRIRTFFLKCNSKVLYFPPNIYPFSLKIDSLLKLDETTRLVGLTPLILAQDISGEIIDVIVCNNMIFVKNNNHKKIIVNKLKKDIELIKSNLMLSFFQIQAVNSLNDELFLYKINCHPDISSYSQKQKDSILNHLFSNFNK